MERISAYALPDPPPHYKSLVVFWHYTTLKLLLGIILQLQRSSKNPPTILVMLKGYVYGKS